MRNLLLIATTCLLLYSCSDSQPRTIKVNNKYSLDIPGDMSPMTIEKNPDASLQYANLWKEMYIMVIDESKSEFENIIKSEYMYDYSLSNFGNYVQILSEGFKESFDMYNKPKITDVIIGGKVSKEIEVYGYIDGVGISGIVYITEGDEDFYQIFVWTLSSKKSKNLSLLEEVALTFKEI